MSEEAKHTPGPWRIAGKMIDSDGHAVVARVFNEVRDPILSNVPLATMAANSNLIAAAPDLLEALEVLLEKYEDRKCQFGDSFLWEKHEDPHALAQAKAAIAKATGKEDV